MSFNDTVRELLEDFKGIDQANRRGKFKNSNIQLPSRVSGFKGQLGGDMKKILLSLPKRNKRKKLPRR